MNIDDWDKDKIEALKKGNPLAQEAAHFIEEIIGSPFFNGYVAVLTTINNLNAELQGGAVTIISEANVSADGKVEIKDKAFERGHKFITEIQSYYDQLEYFRKHLTPQEVENVEERAIDLLDEARLNLRKKNGKVQR